MYCLANVDTSLCRQPRWIHIYIEATMWIHQHSEIPDAWKMWMHSYNSDGNVDTCLNTILSTY